jgi:putative flippase GtrA
MRALIRQFGAYGLASAAAFCLDFGIFTLLTRVADWHYLVAGAVSFTAGGVFLYALSVRYVFQFRRIERGSVELSYFVGLGVAGLVINMLAMYVAVDGLDLPALAAKVGAAGCTFCVNFILRRQFLFSRSY